MRFICGIILFVELELDPMEWNISVLLASSVWNTCYLDI